MRRAGVGDAEEDESVRRVPARPRPSWAPELVEEDVSEDEEVMADHTKVVKVVHAVREAADKLGHVPAGSAPPAWLQNYSCQPLLGFLCWEAASTSTAKPVFAWLGRALEAANVKLQLGDFNVTGREAAQDGLQALQNFLGSVGVVDEEALAKRLRARHRRARPGKALGAAAVHELLGEAARYDERVSFLDKVAQHLVLARGRETHAAPDGGGLDAHGAARTVWGAVDTLDLRTAMLKRVPCLKKCPAFLRTQWRQCLRHALALRRVGRNSEDPVAELRGWKLFLLAPFMLLHRPTSRGSVGKADLEKRFDDFKAEKYSDLLAGAMAAVLPFKKREGRPDKADDEGEATFTCQGATERGRRAEAWVRMGEASRARQCLTGAEVAPGTEETLQALKEKRPAGQRTLLPDDVMNFQPAAPLSLERGVFVDCVKTAPRGAAPGPGGCTYEMLKVMLGEDDTLEELLDAAQDFARAHVPAPVATALAAATLTALKKPAKEDGSDGGVRGIATGATLRRLTARTLARQFGAEIDAACSPFQYALSTRAGTDCVAHVVRATLEARPTATLLSIDGVGAYDYVSRAGMLGKLRTLQTASAMLPFVRMFYAAPSQYMWRDDRGEEHVVLQGEGGEQGDALMPHLFSLGVHDALAEVNGRLGPHEMLFAFLDDVYVIAEPARIRTIYDDLASTLYAQAGIRLNEGKTRVYNTAGVCPEGMGALGGEVWSPAGVKVLGTPVGSADFVQQHADKRLADEKRLWDALQEVPDLQCAWVILLLCCGPRANHLLRTLPPSQSARYAEAHDEGMWDTFERLLRGVPGDVDEVAMARALATLPLRFGGLGMRSAARTANAAYWASLADTLPMIRERMPESAQEMVKALQGETATTEHSCLAEAREAAGLLQREGFARQPTWPALMEGQRPPRNLGAEPGEWPHGWQYYASSTREHFFRRHEVLAKSMPADQAHLRSHSGRNAGAALSGVPTAKEYELEPFQCRTLLLERLRLPLSLGEATCTGCGCPVDARGRHYASCTKTGRLKKRAAEPERVLARICREAGAVVRQNVLLKNLNANVRASDKRAVEVVAQGLPCRGGKQLAVDVTLRSVLAADGTPHSRAASADGVVALRARQDKQSTYPELVKAPRCELVVVAVETGGRFCDEAAHFLEELAYARARDVTPLLRGAACLAWQRRWTRMLATACARAYATSLVAPTSFLGNVGVDGPSPLLSDLLER
jgi:hypothetical protein